MTQRMHVHLTVTDLAASAAFYERLFGRAPELARPDMVKWLLDDPALNFAISAGSNAGVSHLGLELDSNDALQTLSATADPDDAGVSETRAQCCYAVSDKHWLQDPDAISWELFHTLSRDGDDDNESQAAGAEAEAAPRMMPSYPGNGMGGCC